MNRKSKKFEEALDELFKSFLIVKRNNGLKQCINLVLSEVNDDEGFI